MLCVNIANVISSSDIVAVTTTTMRMRMTKMTRTTMKREARGCEKESDKHNVLITMPVAC